MVFYCTPGHSGRGAHTVAGSAGCVAEGSGGRGQFQPGPPGGAAALPTMASTEQQDPEGLVGAELGMGAAVLITSFLRSLPTV